MKAYEKHVAKNGKPSSHSEAKEIVAGLAGAFIDREVESRGVRRLLRCSQLNTVLPNAYCVNTVL